MSRPKWTSTAADDLQRIAEFIREFRPASEQAIVGSLVEKTNNLLLDHPRIGQQREVKADGTELRSLLVGKHYRIVYEVSLADKVEIMQVLDLRSDNK